jgi:ABC-type phosphate/phosphonate transport system substrate-binding protein
MENPIKIMRGLRLPMNPFFNFTSRSSGIFSRAMFSAGRLSRRCPSGNAGAKAEDSSKRDKVRSSQEHIAWRIAFLAFATAFIQIAFCGEPEIQGSTCVHFALSSSVIEPGVATDDALAAVKVWASGIGKGIGAWTTSDASVYHDLRSLAGDLNRNEIDVASVGAHEYVELEGNLNAEPVLVYVQSGKPEVEYVIIVHKESGFNSPADLRGKRLSFTKGGKSSLLPLWLDAVMIDNHLPAKESFLQEIKEASKTSQVVLPVFFRQIDAGAILKSAFDTAVTLNPQIGQKVKIIATSPPLVPQITCFRKNLPAETKAQFLKGALSLNDAPYGIQTFNIIKLERLLPFEPRYLDNVRDLVKKRKLASSGSQVQYRAQAPVLERTQQ